MSCPIQYYQLVDELKAVRVLGQRGPRILLVLERRHSFGGCDFDRFLHVTPEELVVSGVL